MGASSNVNPSTPAGSGTSAPAAAAAPTPTPNERVHVHHSYIWLGGLRLFAIILFAVVVGSLSSIIGLVSELGSSAHLRGAVLVPVLIAGVMGLLVVGLGITMGARAWSYRHLWYEVGPEEFSLYSGILNKKRVHVPYQRIQSVDQRATLLQRIFGVCSVSIDTAGGSSNKAIVVPYVTKSAAETLRRELFARKQWVVDGGAAGAMDVGQSVSAPASGAPGAPVGAPVAVAAAPGAAASAGAAAIPAAPGAAQGNILDVGDEAWREVGGVFAGPAVDTGRVSFEYGLSNKELLLSALSNNTGFAVIVLVVFAGLCQVLAGAFDLFPEVGDAAVGMATSLAAQQGVLVVIGWASVFIIGAAVVGWAISTLSTCLAYGGFHARRRNDRIEVERGLLQHQSQSVSVERVQSVMVKQTFIRRLIGYCEISLGRVDANVGNEESSTNKSAATSNGIVIHPFVKKDRVAEILNGLIPEFADLPSAPDQQRKVAPVGLRRGLIRRSIWQGGGFWLALLMFLFQGSMHLCEQFVSPNDAAEYASVLGFIDMAAIPVYALAALLFVLDIIGAVLWFRSSSFGVNERFMEVTNGGFSTVTVSFPRGKIQFGYTKTNPFQRMARTASIHARTAAGVGGTTVRLIDATEEDAAAWLDWVKPGGARNGLGPSVRPAR